jgi:hypothetical protein
MEPCCVPYCFLVSLSGFILLVLSTQLGVGLGLQGEYHYLHIHTEDYTASAGTSLQAACFFLVPCLVCLYLLCRGSPAPKPPAYLLGPLDDSEPSSAPNSTFDAATNKTPLLSKD